MPGLSSSLSAVVAGLGCTCLLIASGCAGLGGQMVDYATADQGATVTVSGTTGDFSARNLIDGVTKVETWTPESGWEYTFERGGGFSRRGGGGIENNMSMGSAWVHIKFPEVRRVNRIAVYGLNIEEMPFPGIMNGLAQVHTPSDDFSPWKTVGQIEKGFLVVPGKQATRVRPTTTFRFNQIDADEVRVIIYTMADSRGVTSEEPAQSQRCGGGRGGFGGRGRASSVQETTVRLVEIEVTGSEAVKQPAAPATDG